MNLYFIVAVLLITSLFSLSAFLGSALVTGMKLHSMEFTPYKNQSKLLLKADGNSSISGYLIQGQTTNQSEGFSTFVGSNIGHALVTLGAVNKTSLEESRGEGQISFVFNIDGEEGDYKIVLVNGRLASWGWTNNTYFLGANPDSVNFLDFPIILSDRDDKIAFLRSIDIGVDKYLSLDPLEFRIDLFNSSMIYPSYNSSMAYRAESLAFK
jgi:hypothetical protein